MKRAKRPKLPRPVRRHDSLTYGDVCAMLHRQCRPGTLSAQVATLLSALLLDLDLLELCVPAAAEVQSRVGVEAPGLVLPAEAANQ